MPQPSMHAGESASPTRSISSSPSRLRLAASPSTCAPRPPRLMDSSATPIAPPWTQTASQSSRETGITANDPEPSPWAESAGYLRTISTESARHSPHSPDKKSRPRPTIRGRGRGFESVRSTEGARHSHSMVAGGLEVTSRTTRLTSGTELVMRVEMRARTS